MDMGEAHTQLALLRATLSSMVERDPDQEVNQPAIDTLDTVLTEVRALLPDHAVVSKVRDLISPENVAAGHPIMAADLLHVVNALYAAILGPYQEWEKSRRPGPLIG